ncbi:MAG: carboxypeptidase-like regulatory domain-containing protein [Chitinophagaceae bacterium]
MAKKIQLTIAEPCHENWDGMTPVEKGRFCGSCQKQVVDFSNMSDRQVAEFFKKPSTGSVCGRFMTDQLDREIEIPKKRIPWVKYFFQIALPAFLVSIKVSASKTQGKIKVNAVSDKDTTRRPVYDDIKTMGMVSRPQNIRPLMGDTIITPVKKPVESIKGEINVLPKTTIPPPVCDQLMGAVIDIADVELPVINKKEITGRVVDENGNAVAFASIETGKEHKGIAADENGMFKIKRSWLGKSDKLIVSSAGYESNTIVAGREDFLSEELYVQLKANASLPEVVVMALGMTKVSCRYMTGAVSYVKGETLNIIEETKNTDKSTNSINDVPGLLVYPNPLQAGATLNLSFKKMEEGYYQLQIINLSGQTVDRKEIWIDAEARLLNINMPLVSAGSYFLVLTNRKTGKKFSEKIIIQ